MEPIAHYLGPDKKPQSIRKHLQEVAHTASILAGKISLSSMGELAGLLHDLGKYSEAFQVYIRSAGGRLDPDAEVVDASSMKGKIDHSTSGAQMVWEAAKDRDPMSRLMAQVIALCVASHHSGLIDCLSPDGEDKFSDRMAKKTEESHLHEVLQVADREILDKTADAICSPRCREELTAQLKHLLRDEHSQEVREFYLGLLARFLFSALIDADRLSAAGRSEIIGAGTARGGRWNSLIERIERHIAEIKQNN